VSQEAFRCVPVSDFNIQNLCAYLQNDEAWPRVECVDTPYGQVAQLLLDANAPAWSGKPDFALVWTLPEGVLDSFRRLLDGDSVDADAVLEDVDGFVEALLPLQDRARFVLVPTWTLRPDRRAHSLIGLNDRRGIDRVLLQANLRLLDALSGNASFHVLNAMHWTATVGASAFSPKLWYMGKVPFSNALFKEALVSIKSAVRGIAGRSSKLIVVDLDDTLWGGIVGDDGKEGLRLGGHDPIGESFVDFQRALRRLTKRGILLGIVSKNEESTALDAIETHPEMLLRPDDFAGWRINWQDKAQNLADLVSDLNLGLESVVFVDDNPIERARVREAFPEVLVPDWPEDRSQYARTLEALPCFDAPTLSEVDLARVQMYTSERKRSEKRRSFESLESWLRTLETVVRCEVLNEANLPRAAQLLNKTNQMNLTTRRLPEPEFWQWSQEDGRRVWTFRVADKMGDLGLTGILSLESESGVGRIIDFVLSCRVMGRKIEETMISTAVSHAKRIGLEEVVAEPIPTAKNMPCLRFWSGSGFERDGEEGPYRWSTERTFDTPEVLRLEAPGS